MSRFGNRLLPAATFAPATHNSEPNLASLWPTAVLAQYPTIQLVTPEAAAAALGLAVQTLARWRCEGYGPRHVRLSGGSGGGRVAYRVADVEAWIAGRVVASTSQRVE